MCRPFILNTGIMGRLKKEINVDEAVMGVDNHVENASAEIVAGDIPGFVDKILKEHQEFERLWVNSKGWIFTEQTPEHMTGGGVLYDNKYYNNK